MKFYSFVVVAIGLTASNAFPFERRQDLKSASQNLQPFTGAIGGKAAPKITKNDSDRPFSVDGVTFQNLATAIQRSCDIQANQCQNFFNSLPNGNKNGIQQGDCNAQGDRCRRGDNSKSDAASSSSSSSSTSSTTKTEKASVTKKSTSASETTTTTSSTSSKASKTTSSSETESASKTKTTTSETADAIVSPAAGADPKNKDTAGADTNTDPKASNQNTNDAKANDAIDKGTVMSAVGGKGGVDPATGETLLALPAESSFCKSSDEKPSDGTQLRTGSCSSLPQGQIPEVDKMISSIITEPANGAKLKTQESFDVTVQIKNLQTGFFSDAAKEYYTQPQTLNANGQIKGHSHITIQLLTSQTTAPDANTKAFFKGLNDKATGSGQLTVNVPQGTITTAGLYRICSMAGAFSHQPVVMPIAQRGAQDDCIRITVA